MFIALLFILLILGNFLLTVVTIAVLIYSNQKEIQYFLQNRGFQVDLKQCTINSVNFSFLKYMKLNIKKSTIIGAGVLLLLFLAARSAFIVIEHGTVGVLTRFGRVTGQVLAPGLNFKIPFIDAAVIYNTQKIIYETSDTPTDSMADYTDFPVDTTTQDGQQITVRYSVRFSVNPEKVTWVANNLGKEEEIVEKIVKTDSRIHTRNVPRQYSANDLYTGNVQEVQMKIAEQLEPIFITNGLILDEFGIRSIKFNLEYVDAIESKQIEAEKVITEQNIAEQEKFKKQAQITKAEGEAEAQRLQQQTLTNEILQKMWIEKWDGQLPTYQGSGTPLIQLPEKQ